MQVDGPPRAVGRIQGDDTLQLLGESLDEAQPEGVTAIEWRVRRKAGAVVRIFQPEHARFGFGPADTDGQGLVIRDGMSKAVGEQLVDQQAEGLGDFDVEPDVITLQVPLYRLRFFEQGILHPLHIFADEVGELDFTGVGIEVEVLVDQ